MNSILKEGSSDVSFLYYYVDRQLEIVTRDIETRKKAARNQTIA